MAKTEEFGKGYNGPLVLGDLVHNPHEIHKDFELDKFIITGSDNLEVIKMTNKEYPDEKTEDTSPQSQINHPLQQEHQKIDIEQTTQKLNTESPFNNTQTQPTQQKTDYSLAQSLEFEHTKFDPSVLELSEKPTNFPHNDQVTDSLLISIENDQQQFTQYDDIPFMQDNNFNYTETLESEDFNLTDSQDTVFC